ncbi:MAG: hypothetical protein RL716_730 [Actinomycetota bacterium]|jgi:urea carboxylase-associated protein 2
MVSKGTATTAGAKAHAREQEATVVATSPTRPAPTGELWREVIAGGNYSHKVLSRGTEVTLTDLEGDTSASILLYNADQTFERLNIADTVKVQWQVYASAGYLLLSDQGRVMASVIADDSTHHDTIFGASTLARNKERYGDGTVHSPSPSGRELLVLAGSKNGLGRVDIAPCISFFMGVRISENGSPAFLGSAGAGKSVTLRAEMPLVMLVANTAHPLDPRKAFSSSPLGVVARNGKGTTSEDDLWNLTPEGRRAFTNTQEYLAARGIA